jgi:oxygen-independent coproporphyrinogen-3 oxidase
VSQSVERAKFLVPGYVEKLKEEIRHTGEIAAACGLRLETVYFGGGTPTTLSAEQLSQLIGEIRGSFDCSTVREFTVEAGRPDTITMEKLQALRECGVDRISINPQTMNDAVLERIGRRHTAQQTEEAFRMARECGFGNINMDTIAGLPGESTESFCRTLQILTDWDPESITVHTLALKRSSNFNQNEDPRQLDGGSAEKMVEYSQQLLPQKGYAPYYLYRQSRMLANLENIGWSKPGFENLYNIFIMEETHTILACGAGAVTKFRQPGGERIERIFNFKYPYEYNNRFEELLQRKKHIREFYAGDFSSVK